MAHEIVWPQPRGSGSAQTGRELLAASLGEVDKNQTRRESESRPCWRVRSAVSSIFAGSRVSCRCAFRVFMFRVSVSSRGPSWRQPVAAVTSALLVRQRGVAACPERWAPSGASRVRVLPRAFERSAAREQNFRVGDEHCADHPAAPLPPLHAHPPLPSSTHSTRDLPHSHVERRQAKGFRPRPRHADWAAFQAPPCCDAAFLRVSHKIVVL